MTSEGRGDVGGVGVGWPDGGGDLGYLFMVTYGRSGSTLLNGILNSIPGYLVRGENQDALRHLQDFTATVLDARARHPRTSARTHPWFGIGDVPPRRLTAGVRALALETLLRPKPTTRVTGYKEVRWARADVAEHVAWLREVFPGARFVLNTRDHAAVLRSGWWAEEDPGRLGPALVVLEERLRRVVADLGPAGFHVHYDDYVADHDALRPLFAWLGEDFDRTTVDAVMARPHSKGNKAPEDLDPGIVGG